MQTHFKSFQRQLRKNMPLPEVLIWQKIRNEQLGVKFRRQYTMGNRILDFYSPEIKLGIEIDGESHFINARSRQDEIMRDRNLNNVGIKVLRFTNIDVCSNLGEVCLEVLKEVEARLSPSSILPLKKGEKGGGFLLEETKDAIRAICDGDEAYKHGNAKRVFSLIEVL